MTMDKCETKGELTKKSERECEPSSCHAHIIGVTKCPVSRDLNTAEGAFQLGRILTVHIDLLF